MARDPGGFSSHPRQASELAPGSKVSGHRGSLDEEKMWPENKARRLLPKESPTETLLKGVGRGLGGPEPS